jgi:hypothetical protein
MLDRDLVANIKAMFSFTLKTGSSSSSTETLSALSAHSATLYGQKELENDVSSNFSSLQVKLIKY